MPMLKTVTNYTIQGDVEFSHRWATELPDTYYGSLRGSYFKKDYFKHLPMLLNSDPMKTNFCA